MDVEDYIERNITSQMKQGQQFCFCFTLTKWNTRMLLKILSIVGILIVIMDNFMSCLMVVDNMLGDPEAQRTQLNYLAAAYYKEFSQRISTDALVFLKYFLPVINVIDTGIGLVSFISSLYAAIKQKEQFLVPCLLYVPFHFILKMSNFIILHQALNIRVATTFVFQELWVFVELGAYLPLFIFAIKLRNFWRQRPNPAMDEHEMALIRGTASEPTEA